MPRRAAIFLCLLGVFVVASTRSAAQPIVGSEFGVSPVLTSSVVDTITTTLRAPVFSSGVEIIEFGASGTSSRRILGRDFYATDSSAVTGRSLLSEHLGGGRFDFLVDLVAFPVTSSDEDSFQFSEPRGGDLFRPVLVGPSRTLYDEAGGLAVGFGSDGDPPTDPAPVQFASPTFITEITLVALDDANEGIGLVSFNVSTIPPAYLNPDGSWNGILLVTTGDLLDLPVTTLRLEMSLFVPALIPEPGTALLATIGVALGCVRRR